MKRRVLLANCGQFKERAVHIESRPLYVSSNNSTTKRKLKGSRTMKYKSKNPDDPHIYEYKGTTSLGNIILYYQTTYKKIERTFIVTPQEFNIRFKEYKEPRKGTVWVNIQARIYNGQELHWGYVYKTETEADSKATLNRIACVEVPWVEGQGLEKKEEFTCGACRQGRHPSECTCS
jgi:hypothetical protein